MTALETAAMALRAAYDGEPVASLRGLLAPDDSASGYAIQAINRNIWLDQGGELAGYKIGLTSKTVQAHFGVDHPNFGILLKHSAIGNGAHSAKRLLQPMVEAEIALILGRDLDDAAGGVPAVLKAIDYAVAAIEIVDCRIAGWNLSIADSVADNASAASFVLGPDPVPLDRADQEIPAASVLINGSLASAGRGLPVRDALEATAWLARTLAQSEEKLRAGHIILTGALCPPVKISPGDEVSIIVKGIGDAAFVYAGA